MFLSFITYLACIRMRPHDENFFRATTSYLYDFIPLAIGWWLSFVSEEDFYIFHSSMNSKVALQS